MIIAVQGHQGPWQRAVTKESPQPHLHLARVAPLIAVGRISRCAAVFLSRWIEVSVVVPLSTANSPITFPLITPNFADKMGTLLTLNTVAKWPSPKYVDPVKHGPALLV